MGNFEDMFERLSGESEERKRARVEKERIESERRQAIFDERQAFLTSNVLPILKEAQSALAEKGVPCQITDNWSKEIGLPTFPQLQFRCAGERRPNAMGGSFMPEGRAAFFTYREDGEFRAGLGKNTYSRSPDEWLKQDELGLMIDRGVEAALDTYIKSIEDSER